MLLGRSLTPALSAPAAPSWCGHLHEGPAPLPLHGQGGAAGTNPYTEGPKRLILIRVDFADLPGPPFSDDTGLNLLTNIHDYFIGTSHGKTDFLLPGSNGAALTSTFRMPLTAAEYGNNNLISQLRADARAAAMNAGFNLNEYDFDMTWMGNVPGFSWAGLGFIGVPGAWLRNTASAGIASHELGHNLGLNHANFWDTSGASVVGPGRSLESADNFDTMGNGGENRIFNTRYKRLLNWIAEEDVFHGVTHGTYRIYAHDMPGVNGLKLALSIPQLNGTNYWVEYRQAIPENPWIQNGVQLRWGFGGNQRTQLLDVTPGSPDGRNDSALLAGQTFSDPLHGIHLTVLNRGGASPPWVDLTLNRGAFPENVPPTLTLQSDLSVVAVGAPVQFQATAQDGNGDDLAYHWEFGDQQFAAHQTSVGHVWSDPGEYRVRCTVSDMKGGRASTSLLIRVGEPGGFRIRGRVRDENGVPVQDARVVTAFFNIALTDSDGRYALTGLPESRYLMEATKEGFEIAPSNFTNLLQIAGSDFEDIDFLARRDGSEVEAAMVPVGSVWRFLEDGSDPGADWVLPNFGDAAWRVGRAQLGYGDGDETTLVNFGFDPENKPVTVYFRHPFVVSNPDELATLLLGVERDDGAVVYLNGNEVFRSNLPIGRITPNTEAIETVGSTEEITFFTTSLAPNLPMPGTNLLAVEVHQQDSDSSDLSFDLFLTATLRTNLAPGLSIANPPQGATFLGPTNLLFRVNAWAGPQDPVDHVDYFIDGNPIGSSGTLPFSMIWPDVGWGDYTLTTKAVTAGGIQLTSGPVRFSVGALLVPADAEWRYFDQGIDLGSSWQSPLFADDTWQSGRAQLGYGDGDEVTVVGFGPDEANKYITTYFRTWFILPDMPAPDQLRLRLLRDDGAVVYINGQEVRRSNLPFLGLIEFNTEAQTTIGGSEELIFEESIIPAAGLLQAINLVAVEVHQRDRSSSDLSFDLELLVPGPDITERPVMGVVWNNQVLQLNWPTNVTGFEIEESLTPGPETPWTLVPSSPFLIDGLFRVFIIPDGPVRFYRLRKP